MIDHPAPTSRPTYPDVPVGYRVAVATIAVLIMLAVSYLDPPIWAGALLTGGLMMAVISILQALLRWRARTTPPTT
ncbi:hypothetical protein ENSA7_02600 [Enhygromyxa salina]|uniref:Uncharacterized protein n=1 Tax=Enhygromyxa salina TaxID=215803 RepID=A0A2S9YY99_9BACT|nr:hypothetical protein ENSA7_02600 [Enhygromyxa salina]